MHRPVTYISSPGERIKPDSAPVLRMDARTPKVLSGAMGSIPWQVIGMAGFRTHLARPVTSDLLMSSSRHA
jgi:hypothetical protein